MASIAKELIAGTKKMGEYNILVRNCQDFAYYLAINAMNGGFPNWPEDVNAYLTRKSGLKRIVGAPLFMLARMWS